MMETLTFNVRYVVGLDEEEVPEGFAEAIATLPTELRVPQGVGALAWSELLGALVNLTEKFSAAWGVLVTAYVGAEGEEPKELPAHKTVLDEEQLRGQLACLADKLGVATERVVAYTDEQGWSYVTVLSEAMPSPDERACVNFSVALALPPRHWRIRGDVECTFQRRWFGQHRGVTWEVRQAPVEVFDDPDLCRDDERPTGYWWHYLHLVEPQFPDDVWSEVWIDPIPQTEPGYEGRVGYPLHGHLLADLDGWHGGLTYYAKRGGHDGAPRTVVAGCDYDHLWDRMRCHTFAEVHRDACRTVDSLWESVPDLRRMCPWTGEYYLEDEGFEGLDGEWRSRDAAQQLMERDLQRREGKGR